MAYTSITVEGELFPSDLLNRIASGKATGQRPADFALDGDSARPARLAAATESAFSDARAHWDSYRRRLQTSPLSATRITREDWLPKLAELLGYGELKRAQSPLEAGGQSYPIYATAGAAPDAPPFHIVGCQQPLDRRASPTARC